MNRAHIFDRPLEGAHVCSFSERICVPRPQCTDDDVDEAAECGPFVIELGLGACLTSEQSSLCGVDEVCIATYPGFGNCARRADGCRSAVLATTDGDDVEVCVRTLQPDCVGDQCVPPCLSDADCAARDPALAHCLPGGRCGCVTDAECQGAPPSQGGRVCLANQCGCDGDEDCNGAVPGPCRVGTTFDIVDVD